MQLVAAAAWLELELLAPHQTLKKKKTYNYNVDFEIIARWQTKDLCHYLTSLDGSDRF